MTRTMEILRARKLPPRLMVECAGNCTNNFHLEDGFAMPVWCPEADRPTMAFFCSYERYLVLVPPINCYGGRQ